MCEVLCKGRGGLHRHRHSQYPNMSASLTLFMVICGFLGQILKKKSTITPFGFGSGIIWNLFKTPTIIKPLKSSQEPSGHSFLRASERKHPLHIQIIICKGARMHVWPCALEVIQPANTFGSDVYRVTSLQPEGDTDRRLILRAKTVPHPCNKRQQLNKDKSDRGKDVKRNRIRRRGKTGIATAGPSD